MTIKAILFDHDGTIADSELAHFNMWKGILLHYGVNLTHDEYVNQYAGIPSKDNAKTIVADYNLDIEPQELIKAKANATNQYLKTQAFPLMSGAMQTIRYFHKQGFKIGIVTGAGKEGVSATIQHHKLSQYISIVVCSDDVIHSKPAPDCYLLAADKLSLQPEQCLAIEDTYNGSVSANNAGIKCIGVSLSKNVLDTMTNTIYQCENLFFAQQWIIKNYPYQDA